jgi:hypothetical protein
MLKYKKYKKPIILVTDDEWSGTLEMLLGLNGDSYSYNQITDNPWPSKTKNKRKKDRVRSVLDIYI